MNSGGNLIGLSHTIGGILGGLTSVVTVLAYDPPKEKFWYRYENSSHYRIIIIHGRYLF